MSSFLPGGTAPHSSKHWMHGTGTAPRASTQHLVSGQGRAKGPRPRFLFLHLAFAGRSSHACIGLIVDLLLDACDHAARWGSNEPIVGLKTSSPIGVHSKPFKGAHEST